jgi:hypothetical protein
VFVAGIPVRDEAILELARLVEDAGLADKLETAYGRETKVLALTIAERETIIRALVDARPALRSFAPSSYASTSPACVMRSRRHCFIRGDVGLV